MISYQPQLDRIERECACRETERANFWSTGKFSLPGLELTQELIAALPDPRTEALAALAKIKLPEAEVSPDLLRLTAIGWIDRPLAQLSEDERLGLVEQAIARLAVVKDADLLASARLVAAALPNYRTRYTDRLAPIVAWAKKHRDDIEEEAAV